jgi:hypothetical protein
MRNNIGDGYQAECIHCRRHVGEPFDLLPRARLAANAKGDLVMRTVVADGCPACGTTEVEIVVRRQRSA